MSRIHSKGSLFFGEERKVSDRITITLVANAGVLVEYKGTGLLVDGIHHQKGHPFSPVPLSDIKIMQQGSGIFKNLDYLLFTHEHPDHFTPQYVSEHISQCQVKGLFLPAKDGSSSHYHLLLDHLQKMKIPHWGLGVEPGEMKAFPLKEDLTVTVIGTRHMGPQFQDIRNDCFLLTIGDKNLLFTGDADHVADYFESALKGVSIEAVFVNPLFFHNTEGQKIIHDIFSPRHIVIYHLPFEQDDAMRLSRMVYRDIEKNDRYGHNGIQTHVFHSRKQFLTLSASA